MNRSYMVKLSFTMMKIKVRMFVKKIIQKNIFIIKIMSINQNSRLPNQVSTDNSNEISRIMNQRFQELHNIVTFLKNSVDNVNNTSTDILSLQSELNKNLMKGSLDKDGIDDLSKKLASLSQLENKLTALIPKAEQSLLDAKIEEIYSGQEQLAQLVVSSFPESLKTNLQNFLSSQKQAESSSSVSSDNVSSGKKTNLDVKLNTIIEGQEQLAQLIVNNLGVELKEKLDSLHKDTHSDSKLNSIIEGQEQLAQLLYNDLGTELKRKLDSLNGRPVIENNQEKSDFKIDQNMEANIKYLVDGQEQLATLIMNNGKGKNLNDHTIINNINDKITDLSKIQSDILSVINKTNDSGVQKQLLTILENSNYQSMIEILKKTVNNLGSLEQNLTSNLFGTSNILSSVDKEIKKVIGEIKELSFGLNQEISSFHGKLENNNGYLAKFEVLVNEFKTKVTHSENLIQSTQNTIINLKESVDGVKINSLQLIDKMSLLNSDNEIVNNKIADLSQTTSQILNILTVFSQTLNSLVKENVSIQNNLTVVDTQLNKTQFNLENLKNQLIEIKSDLMNVSSNLSHTNEEISNTRDDINNVQITLDSTKSELVGVKSDILSVKSDVAHVQLTLLSNKNDTLALKSSVENINGNNEKTYSVLGEIKSNLSVSNSELGLIKENYINLTTDITNNTSGLNGLKTELSSVKEGLFNTKSNIEQFKSDLSGLRTSIDNVNFQNNQNKNSLNDLAMNVTSTQKLIESTGNNLSAISTNDQKTLESNINILNAKLRELNQHVNDNNNSMNENVTSFQKEFNTSVTELNEKVDTLNSSVNTMEKMIVSLENKLKYHQPLFFNKTNIDAYGVYQITVLKQELIKLDEALSFYYTANGNSSIAIGTISRNSNGYTINFSQIDACNVIRAFTVFHY